MLYMLLQSFKTVKKLLSKLSFLHKPFHLTKSSSLQVTNGDL